MPSSPAADRGDVAAAAVHVVGCGRRLAAGGARPACAALGVPGRGAVVVAVTSSRASNQVVAGEQQRRRRGVAACLPVSVWSGHVRT